MNLDQYAYSVTFVADNLVFPVRVIADTSEGMLIEAADVWKALGIEYQWTGNPSADAVSAETIADKFRSRFKGFSGLQVHQVTIPNRDGARVHIHLKMKGAERMHRLYFTWANTLVLKLPDPHLITFKELSLHVGETFPQEFDWNQWEYEGKHRELPITVKIRGTHLGICKVHLDMPGQKQVVFRGDPYRVVDMIIQAKEHAAKSPQ